MSQRDYFLVQNERKGREFTEALAGKNPLFICVIGTTDTAQVQGLTAAGENVQLAFYTPAADVEFLHFGVCKSIEGVPITPEGIPTPALITSSALRLANIPSIVVNAGARIPPQLAYVELGGAPGGDIRMGNGVPQAESIFHRGRMVGALLSHLSDFLVIGESIPAGTTTAQAVLSALGVNAAGKVSSSMPNNPHNLKREVVEGALRSAGLDFGAASGRPLQAVASVGDPVIAGAAGILVGAAPKASVMLAGGTQMCAVLAVARGLEPSIVDDVAVATTRWLVEDKQSDIRGLMREVAAVPLLAANLTFASSRFEGLKAYEAGVVKEGVGTGGACVAASLKSKGSISANEIIADVEATYSKLTAMRNQTHER